jgi:hypothetical protein
MSRGGVGGRTDQLFTGHGLRYCKPELEAARTVHDELLLYLRRPRAHAGNDDSPLAVSGQNGQNMS